MFEGEDTLGASNNLSGVGRDVYSSDCLVMAGELVFQLEAFASSLVQVDVILSGDGKGLAISGEGVIRNWMVE